MERHILAYGGRHGRPRRRGKKRFWAVLTLAILTPIVLAGLAGLVAFYRVTRNLPDVARLAAYRPSQTTEIYSSDGLLLARLFDENRRVVPLSDIPEDLRKATIAVEDHRFFEHRGVDWRGAARAFVANVRGGDYVQGGSTITQQLVRNVFLSPDKRLSRKVREAVLAVQLEHRFSKPEILGMYLNQVYYGERCFGVEAASRRYFGKPVHDISLAEAALLAGIPQRPGFFDPYANPKAAQQRRNLVLQRMADVGFVPAARARAAMNQPIRLAYTQPPRLTVRRAPWFVDYVVQQLEERYGAETVFRGGLKVQTTLNTRAQDAAEEAVSRGMNAHFGRRSRTQAALVSLDPTTGYIRAMVGGRDYRRSVYNRAVQAKRQPGSAFKPFVYAVAMKNGFTPATRITDAPVVFAGLGWRPHNYDGRWHGTVTLTEALAESINIPAIKLLDTVGPSAVVSLAHDCGLESPLTEDLSLALGTSEVTPLELASAYGTFASGGDHTPPIAILRVRDARGDLLESNVPDPADVLDAPVARRMDFMLRQVVRIGTGRPAGGIPDARGKTGTTDDLKDAWFVGYTPSLVTAVWVGNDKPSRIPGLTGGGACAPIWASYMRRALSILPAHPLPDAFRPPAPFATPEGDRVYVAESGPQGLGPDAAGDADVSPDAHDASGAPDDGAAVASASMAPMGVVTRRICLESGLLATRGCPETVVEDFPAGTEPTEHCTLHRSAERLSAASAGSTPERGRVVLLCRESGGLAGPDCRNVETVVLPPGAPIPRPCALHAPRRSRLGEGDAGEASPRALASLAAMPGLSANGR